MKPDGSQVSNIPSYNDLLPIIKKLIKYTHTRRLYDSEDYLQESYIVYHNCLKRNKKKKINNFTGYFICRFKKYLYKYHKINIMTIRTEKIIGNEIEEK